MDKCVYDQSLGIHVRRDSPFLDYKDGSEEYVGRVLRNLDNMEGYPVDLQGYIKDWPSQYHLSYQRTNLLEAISELFNKEWNVLEIGAGNGALTPWLSERFNNVDSIEGSLERAKNVRLRSRKAANVRVFAGDVTAMNLSGKYGLLSVVGVLEYIPYYNPTQRPADVCRDFLGKLAASVADEGVALFAVENKLGAKYLAGCAEDHNGKLFSGIMDYPDHSALTFSRNELEEMLRNAGFGYVQFYHLFPDYKMPTTIIREDPRVTDIGVTGFVRGLFEDRTGGREFCFHDTLFIHSLEKAGLMDHFANSFLVLCAKKESVNLKTDFLIRKFWNRETTKPDLHHSITVTGEKDHYKVTRAPLKGGVTHGTFGNALFRLDGEQPFLPGNPLIIEAYKAAISGNSRERLVVLLRELMGNLTTHFSVEGEEGSDYPLVSGDGIDYCFWNLVREESGDLQFIDRKWSTRNPIPIDFVLFRNLYYLFQDVYPFVTARRLSDFAVPLLQAFFPRYTKSRFSEHLEREARFQSDTRTAPVDFFDVEGGEFAGVPLTNLKAQLQEKEKYLSEITSGRGWRLLSVYYRMKARITGQTRKARKAG
ncbi:MAG TPA: methyltransferase domain-containing protein [Syntrophorhabdaceae bacterium]|jgi:SAM-dependent methyltransferase